MKHGYKKAFRFFFFVFSCFSGSRFLSLFFFFFPFLFLVGGVFPVFFFPTAFRRPDVFFPASFFPRVSIEAFFLSFFFLSFFFFRFFLNVFFGWWTFFCSLKPLWSPPTQGRTLDVHVFFCNSPTLRNWWKRLFFHSAKANILQTRKHKGPEHNISNTMAQDSWANLFTTFASKETRTIPMAASQKANKAFITFTAEKKRLPCFSQLNSKKYVHKSKPYQSSPGPTGLQQIHYFWEPRRTPPHQEYL